MFFDSPLGIFTYFLVIIVVFVGSMMVASFRKSFMDVILFRDPFGREFYRKNWWFTVFSIIWIFIAPLFF